MPKFTPIRPIARKCGSTGSPPLTIIKRRPVAPMLREVRVNGLYQTVGIFEQIIRYGGSKLIRAGLGFTYRAQEPIRRWPYQRITSTSVSRRKGKDTLPAARTTTFGIPELR